MELANGTTAVVDPEVQARVSSLVTAVCFALILMLMATADAFCSLEGAAQMKKDDMCSVTTLWHVCAI
jgi:hypothetical protein